MTKKTIEDVDDIQPDEWLISGVEFKCKGPYDNSTDKIFAKVSIKVYDSGRAILKCNYFRKYGVEKIGKCSISTKNRCSCPFDVLRKAYAERGRIL
tara:strand:- start:583 stop:870 length:288 start_codon:yes stop_codon:yes gene_type:complete